MLDGYGVCVNFCYLYEGLAGTRMLGYKKANNEDACVISLQF
jgi:hypothetical protein